MSHKIYYVKYAVRDIICLRFCRYMRTYVLFGVVLVMLVLSI
jgi:hypothetical protein